MKIAFVALPEPTKSQSSRTAPPLALGYIAALLEQQRHIVRIYDLAISGDMPLQSVLRPLRTFRPHLIVVAGACSEGVAPIEAVLGAHRPLIVQIDAPVRDTAPGQVVAQALWRLDQRAADRDEHSVIFEALLALDHDLDSLPFPARHLLSLEQYPLFTPAGDLQTTVLAVQQLASASIIPRAPTQLIAEMQSIVREHGIRHFVFPTPAITSNLPWLRRLLDQLAAIDLGPCWEACAWYRALDSVLLRALQRAGCEVLCLPFSAGDVLDSSAERAVLSHVVQQAHDLGISVRGQITLEPPYAAIPALVDVSATFGFDDVHFRVALDPAADQRRPAIDGLTLEDVAEMARVRYRSSRSKQFFVDRFGPQLGPMLWHVGRVGLLGRTWRRYATGSEAY